MDTITGWIKFESNSAQICLRPIGGGRFKTIILSRACFFDSIAAEESFRFELDGRVVVAEVESIDGYCSFSDVFMCDGVVRCEI